MGIKWSDPKIEKEKVKIEPEVFIKEAKEYTESGDYNMAERAYVNALSNARGASNVKGITRIVKDGLSDIYKLWTQDCINRYEYQEAEPVLQKLLKISDDKTAVKRWMIEIYGTWATHLNLDAIDKRVREKKSDYDRIYSQGYLSVLFRKYRLEREIGYETDGTLRDLISELKNNKTKMSQKEFRNDIVQLFFLDKGKKARNAALVLAFIAVLTPILSSKSFILYIIMLMLMTFSNLINADMNSLLKGGKEEKLIFYMISKLTFISYIWILVWIIIRVRFHNIALIGTLILAVLQSIRSLTYSIRRLKAYHSIQGISCDADELLVELLGEDEFECKKCGHHFKVTPDIIGKVKCPECNELLRNEKNLRLSKEYIQKMKESGKNNNVNIIPTDNMSQANKVTDVKSVKYDTVCPMCNKELSVNVTEGTSQIKVRCPWCKQVFKLDVAKSSFLDNPGMARVTGGAVHLLVNNILRNLRF